MFQLLGPEETGVNFMNVLNETEQMNIFTYLYYYNGGGVATGDFNGDDLIDLYFTSNQDSNRLYLNKGNFKFEDVTSKSGAWGMKGWTTGVAIADVNRDGLLDIYVSQLGDYKNVRGKNQLLINQGIDNNGIPRFEDKASEWGLDLVGFSTQAAFFDYDLDGDLDMYMLNHSVHSNGTFVRSTIRNEVHPLAGDKLMRNDGDHFTNVTTQSGIYSSALGYGLGISVGDINADGFPDIYVGNDFHEDDYLYINNGNGTFTESLASSIRHTSRFSMGNDIADINNDGLNDIISLDMLPHDPYILKTAAGEDTYDVHTMKMGYGYKEQYARNSLQLNMGNGKFSDIGLMLDVYATDWSWSGLFADFDLDGLNDLYITNGIKRRPNDNDFINYISDEAIQQRLEGDLTSEELKLIEKMPVVKIPNYAFKNTGNLSFQDVSTKWGLDQKSFSNGAAYADLDNDGDLDIVLNNIDQPTFIYRNNLRNGSELNQNNYLKFRFRGDSLNTFGIGARVIIPLDSGKIVRELYTTRGFQSSVAPELIIGVGSKTSVDSITIVWPDKSLTILQNIDANQTITIDKSGVSGLYTYSKQKPPVVDYTDSIKIDYKHIENRFVEFHREFLVPQMASTEGPKMAVGDVNNDGLEDLFICGAKHQAGQLFIQNIDGTLNKSVQSSFHLDSVAEDVDAIFIDVDSDKDLDLFVVSGGNEFHDNSVNLSPRVYINDGTGRFIKDETAIADVFVNGSCVRPYDFDGDGDLDVFIGGRVIPWKYGISPDSYLLKNDGKGNFNDVTNELAPDLKALGMVKDAQWADFNNDGVKDLIIVGDWMPITFLLSDGKKFNRFVPASLAYSNGLWNSIQCVDIDNDGDIDVIGGNLGLNSKFKASKNKPITSYINDFDGNGNSEALIYYFYGDEEILFSSKDELSKQLVELKKKYPTYESFAKANPKEIVSKQKLNDSKRNDLFELRSGYFINQGNNNFTFKPFPKEAQFSPIESLLIFDFNKDGEEDILVAGNYFEANIQLGRYDASYGTIMVNSKDGFNIIPNLSSGLYLDGQVRDLKPIVINNERFVLVARNNDSLRVLKLE